MLSFQFSKAVSSQTIKAQRRLASSLVLCQHKNGEYDQTLLNIVSAAKAVGGPISVLVAAKDAETLSSKVAQIENVDKVFAYSNEKFAHPSAESMTKLVAKLFGTEKFSHVFVAATNEGKNVAPRIAAKLDGAAVSEILSVSSENNFIRPMYAGNVLASVSVSHVPKVLTVRATNFDKSTVLDSPRAKVTKLDYPESDTVSDSSQFISEDVVASDRPEITAASIVVSGGRALKSADNFELLYKLADKLTKKCNKPTAVGASRAAVDAGYAPNDMQVGQTGKVCAPELYFAVGISGAIQHLAGMKDSKCIVAINTDADSPIFQVADYGLQEDLFKAVPELTEKL